MATPVRDATDEEIRGSYWPDGVVPAGHRVVLVDAAEYDPDWSLLALGRRCRYTTGPGNVTCKRPAVVLLNRGSGSRPQWWGYCDLQGHLYGRVYEPGPPPRLLVPILEPLTQDRA